MNTYFDLCSADSGQVRDRHGVVMNEDVKLLTDATSSDDVSRRSQVRVANLNQNAS